jgi:hypothetical protein
VRTPEFERRLGEALAPLAAGTAILVTQSARPGLTRVVVAVVEALGFVPHVLAHERFLPSFQVVVPEDRVHAFGETFDFRPEPLADRLAALGERHRFGATVVPYNNATGANYDDVHAVAAAVAPVVLGVTVDGAIVRPRVEAPRPAAVAV